MPLTGHPERKKMRADANQPYRTSPACLITVYFIGAKTAEQSRSPVPPQASGSSWTWRPWRVQGATPGRGAGEGIPCRGVQGGCPPSLRRPTSNYTTRSAARAQASEAYACPPQATTCLITAYFHRSQSKTAKQSRTDGHVVHQRDVLMRAARRRDIDAIVVWRLDRWGRSLADLVGTLHELQVLGVGFI